MICNSSLFDIEMFKAVWKSVISAIAHAFISFEEDYIIQRAIAGFRQCATLAGQFHLPDVFDFVVVSLSQVTSLLSESLPARVPNYPVIDVEGQSITVSNLSVKFGTNFKGQLAAVVLFNIVNGNGNAIREGWMQVCTPYQANSQNLEHSSDFRNVSKPVFTLSSSSKDATNGRLPWRPFHDSSPRESTVTSYKQERRRLALCVIIISDYPLCCQY
jgi:Sec7-like guanine-nucleotide exchange factor